jgi:hypothetical protein
MFGGSGATLMDWQGKHFSGVLVQLCIFWVTNKDSILHILGYRLCVFCSSHFRLARHDATRSYTSPQVDFASLLPEEVVEIVKIQPSVSYEYRTHDESATHARERELYTLSCSAS